MTISNLTSNSVVTTAVPVAATRALPLLLAIAASLAASLAAYGTATAQSLEAEPADAGLLDTFITPTPASPQSAGVDTVAPVVNQQALANQVEQQQEGLEELSDAAIESEAQEGDRVAQAALGANFAKEAQSLANIPALSNDAASDALLWYSLAASRGVPGSPAIDSAGIRAFPVRVARERQR